MTERDSLPLRSQTLVDSWIDKFSSQYKIERNSISNLVTCHLDLGDDTSTLEDFQVTHISNDRLDQVSNLVQRFNEQVVLLQFCRASAANSFQDILQKCYEPLMADMHDEWNEQAAIITCFVDDDINSVNECVKKLGLNHLYNTWLQDGWNGAANKNAVAQYGVNGVPHAILIDTEGIVKWKGVYLDDRDQLERWINALIEGRGINVTIPVDENEDEEIENAEKRQKLNHETEWCKIEDSDTAIAKLKEKRDSLFDSGTVSFISLRQKNASNNGINTKGFLTFIGELSSDDRAVFEDEFFRDFVKKSIASDAISRVTFFDRPSLPQVTDTCATCNKNVEHLPKLVSLLDGLTVCDQCSLSGSHQTHITLIVQPGKRKLIFSSGD
jgi:hypothetical protein